MRTRAQMEGTKFYDELQNKIYSKIPNKFYENFHRKLRC